MATEEASPFVSQMRIACVFGKHGRFLQHRIQPKGKLAQHVLLKGHFSLYFRPTPTGGGVGRTKDNSPCHEAIDGKIAKSCQSQNVKNCKQYHTISQDAYKRFLSG